MWALLGIARIVLAAAPAQAHTPAAPGDEHAHMVWTWNADPLALVPVLTLGLLYRDGVLEA